MNVDLIKALDAVPEGLGRGEDGGRGGEFPGVLESKLAAEESGAGPSNADAAGDFEGDVGSRSAESSEGAKQGADGNTEESARAAAESGAGGVAASALAERARQRAHTEASTETAGRLTDLDSKVASGEESALRGDIEEGEALEGEIAEEALREFERLDRAAGEVASNGPEGSRTTSDVAADAGAPGAPNPNAAGGESSGDLRGTAEGPIARESATGDEGREQSARDFDDESARENASRSRDEAAFARAAEGSSAAAVDPNLRQAIANREEAQRAPEVVSVEGAGVVANPIANAVTETTTTSAPGSPTPVAASEAISVQTEWLATRGGGTARLVLHPPELGEIAIRVTLRGGAVDVSMVAQEAVAMSVAEEQSERLAHAFANRDLRLENFEVRRSGSEDLADAGTEQHAESGAGDEERAQQDRERLDQSGGAGRLGIGDADANPMPRIMTVAPENGVDLRI